MPPKGAAQVAAAERAGHSPLLGAVVAAAGTDAGLVRVRLNGITS
jgi:hypothetical protein